MPRINRKFSIYTLISIVAFIAIVFILLIPRFYNVKEKEKREHCIENMQKIQEAIEKYMSERSQSFNGGLVELVRTGYLKHAYECPENGQGDKYIAKGNFDTDEVEVKCPNEKDFPKHKLIMK